MKHSAYQRKTPPVRQALSLLEMILATAMLASSTVLLLSILSAGDQHGRRAEQRVLGQILCQSKLDELITDPTASHDVDQEPINGYPEWVYSVKEMKTELPGVVRWEVSVTWINPTNDTRQANDASSKKTFELIRLQRIPDDSAPASADQPAQPISPTSPTQNLPQP